MGPQGPLARTTDTAADARYYLYDGLGSVVGEVDVNGNVTSAKKYDVYGAARASTGTAKSRQGWVGGLGHETDPETGYTYMRARYYDPVVGRFISEDPAKDGSNWFVYCGNDPVNHFDTNGKEMEQGDAWHLKSTWSGFRFGCELMATAIIFMVCMAYGGLGDRGALIFATAIAMGGAYFIGDALVDCPLKNGGKGDLLSTTVGIALSYLFRDATLSASKQAAMGQQSSAIYGIVGGAVAGYMAYAVICAVYMVTIE